MRILIAEDLPEMAKHIASAVRATDIPSPEFLFAENWHDTGNAALAYHPDLILLDLGHPDSAPERTIEAMPPMARQFPVVVISGQSETIYWRASLRAGAMDYLQKTAFLSSAAGCFLGHNLVNAYWKFHAEHGR